MIAAVDAYDLAYTSQPSVLVISAAGANRAAQAAADHAGLRVVGTVGFADAAGTIATCVGPDLIAVEATGADPDALSDALPLIGLLARERQVDVVVAMTVSQIDVVANQLLGDRVQLLCDADLADRITAYRLAHGVRSARLHDYSRDADARLDRLNAEVARFADTLAKLAAEGGRTKFGGEVRDSASLVRSDRDDTGIQVDPSDVRNAIRARRMRAAYFAEDLFADPAWDILLDLFAADLEGRQVSVSSLCITAAVPGTTALRWIGSMVGSGLLVRGADAQDRRRAFITLSPTSRQGMQRYFNAVRGAGLTPA